jgi:hypothetical protein
MGSRRLNVILLAEVNSTAFINIGSEKKNVEMKMNPVVNTRP